MLYLSSVLFMGLVLDLILDFAPRALAGELTQMSPGQHVAGPDRKVSTLRSACASVGSFRVSLGTFLCSAWGRLAPGC